LSMHIPKNEFGTYLGSFRSKAKKNQERQKPLYV
jgi:hypothetical protein